MRRSKRLPGSWLEKNKTNKRSEKREMVGGGDSVRRHDPKSSLVVDTVRSTTTGSPIGVWHEATGGLDSFAMLECLAPPSLIIDEWGVSKDILSPPTKSVGPAANDRDQAIECPVPHLPCARRCETPECGAGEQRQAPNSAVVTEDDLVTNNDRV